MEETEEDQHPGSSDYLWFHHITTTVLRSGSYDRDVDLYPFPKFFVMDNTPRSCEFYIHSCEDELHLNIAAHPTYVDVALPKADAKDLLKQLKRELKAMGVLTRTRRRRKKKGGASDSYPTWLYGSQH